MKFTEVLADIERMKGKLLSSIRRGAEIKVLNVDIGVGTITIETAHGDRKSRQISELKVLWGQLRSKPAVHVDMALGGSGSSRNQPETILANLPYVEWFRYQAKKHLAFVGTSTHELGTLREMEDSQAIAIRDVLDTGGIARGQDIPTVIMIVADSRGASNSLEELTGIAAKGIGNGMYEHIAQGTRTLIVPIADIGAAVEAGTYIRILSSTVPKSGVVVRIENRDLHVLSGGGVLIMADHRKQ